MKVGGGGAERFMMTLPLLVAAFMMVYALGGPDRALVILERMANDGWVLLRNLVR
jgi:hypothetical protein